tara:strand:+ start:252 stop:428 length:177 start_codon:yes stop_codon:yes gene_type:complete
LGNTGAIGLSALERIDIAALYIRIAGAPRRIPLSKYSMLPMPSPPALGESVAIHHYKL